MFDQKKDYLHNNPVEAGLKWMNAKAKPFKI